MPRIVLVEFLSKEGHTSKVNFSVPDDVKEAFNATFAGRNKSAIITQLMREAIERADAKACSRAAITRILEARPTAPVRSAKTLRTAREKGRA